MHIFELLARVFDQSGVQLVVAMMYMLD